MWYCNMFTMMKNLPFPLIGTTSTEKFTIHTTIVERLTSRHGNSFKEYKMAAQELDRKVDKLYQSIWIFSDEHYAIPYDPKNRDRLLRAFTDFCTCLETEIASDRSPQAQVLLHIY